MGSEDVCPAADRVVQVSQLPQLSSVQLSSNRVREDYDFDIMDVFPVFPVSPRNDSSLLNKATRLFDSNVGSPVTSLSITDYAADLTLLSEPLILLPEVMLFQPAPAPVLPHTYTGCQPSLAPALSVNPSPAVLSHKGPFDDFTEPADTSDHPLISFGLTGCPYRMMAYHEECISAPESARLLGRPPAEWLQVMNRQDILVAAMQLQRDAGLMASNLTVLSQYVTSLHRMLMEVMQSVFGREFFPSQ